MSNSKLLYTLLAIAFIIISSVVFTPLFTLFNADDQKESETPKLKTDVGLFSYITRTTLKISDNEMQTSNPSQDLTSFREKIKIGVHANSDIDLSAFEQSINKDADIVAVHIHWGNENKFPHEFATEVLERGATLMIFWNPMDYTKSVDEQEPFHFNHILDGSWDEYIHEFVQETKRFDGHVIIAPMEEVNGEWTSWSGYKSRYGTIDQYINSFRYLYDKFEGVQNVDFAWVINHTSVPNVQANSIRTYYPGEGYVDLIGINSFNFGDPWVGFDTLVQEPIKEVNEFDIPIYITSVASAEGAQKAEWINIFFASHFFTEGTLRGFIWFNEDKERNWTIWSDNDSLNAFKKGVHAID